ncbi:shikimate dehydrogenase family protein [Shumkonia mesophila]|uniref:shikimate dehydrogenase family protein n=1 Tax=Shumkonia mesophila TaxID=2838854 RepID=UPI002934CEF3|nr:hypothetical protein [Shumkonia mesophila]
MPEVDKVDFISGATKLFGIVGHPIVQVRSPEMITAEFHRRRQDALMLPIHVLPEDFDAVLPNLMKVENLGGLVFTIPFKSQALRLADEVGPHARVAGAINALARGADGRWRGEVFDGIGCVEAFRRRGISFAGQHVMLIGAGGAGTAMGVAIAFGGPASIRLFDIDRTRDAALAEKIRRIDPKIGVTVGEPLVEGRDILLNATPVGMLDDARLPLRLDALPSRLVVFDAIVKPERTPLLVLAERCGCQMIYGTEMMRGQISQIATHLGVVEKRSEDECRT